MTRPRVAFFDYPDVFEDFYPHYGVSQEAFAASWAGSGNHAILALVQREIADVVWYELSLAPRLAEARHALGWTVRFLRSSRLHRVLWKAFYGPRVAWRWRAAYPAYARVASYAAPLSRAFVSALERDRPDVLFAQDYATGRFDVLALAARHLGIPLVAYHSGSRAADHHVPLLKRWSLRTAARLLVSSADEGRMLTERYGVAPERIAVMLTPIDTTVFHPHPRDIALRRAGLDPRRRHILFVGRLDDRVKRVSALIGAFAPLARAHGDVDLVIAGDGPDRTALERSAAAVGDRVRFTGWIHGAEAKAQLYAGAECLVLPSLSEGFPTVVGEAMACGTPVLASRVGGVPEMVVDGRTGWLWSPGDDAALGQRLDEALARPERLHAMRRAAREMAERRVAPAVVIETLRHCLTRNRAVLNGAEGVARVPW